MKKVIYTYGVFDLIHPGHVALLSELKKPDNILVVGVFTDKVATKFKRVPIMNQSDRMTMVGSLRFVDYVILQDELDPSFNIKRLHPDFVIKGPGAHYETCMKSLAKQFPKTVFKLSKYHPITSTSKIIKKCRKTT